MAMLIYLAGPEVFLAEANAIGARKKAICAEHGFEGVYPFDEPLPTGAMTEVGHRIFDNCVAMMDRCDLVVANMTPWRGISMDVGTAVEIGYMHAQGKPVFGYTNVAADYVDRCDDDGCEIEAFGFHDNLMCEGPVFHSGGHVVRRDVAPDALYTDLEAFEACIRQARQRAGARTARRR
jgi:nucleoside 2-deoxyribosyltransferase